MSWPRNGTKDLSVLKQVFVERQYDFPLPKAPISIADAGTNSGLLAVYFANRYPGASVIAIEPEDSNFKLLKRNASPYP
jgi:methylase of polypeptide subunit release factors